MALIQIDKDPSRRTLIGFGVMWLVFFGVVGVIVWSRTGSPVATGCVWAVAAVAAVGWAAPGFMRLLYLGLSYLTLPIGWVVSHLVLGATWYLVVTPIGLLMRLFGRDPLKRRFEPETSSYWLKHEPVESTDRYFRQF